MEDLWSDASSKMSIEDVDKAWRALLEETLPADKQEALMETYEAERDPRMRYNMLLEFSSYLRQGAAYNENQGTGKGGGANGYGGAGLDPDPDGSLCWEITRVILIVAIVLILILSFAYWMGQMLDQEPHEGDEL